MNFDNYDLGPVEFYDWVDREWGDLVSCKAFPRKDGWPYDKGAFVPRPNPWGCFGCFDVEYENGARVSLRARGWDIINGYGFHGSILNDDKFKPAVEEPEGMDFVFFPKRLVATALSALVECRFIPTGAVMLVSGEEADDALRRYGLMDVPAHRPSSSWAYHQEAWFEKWISSGLVQEEVGEPRILWTKWLKTEEKSLGPDR